MLRVIIFFVFFCIRLAKEHKNTYKVSIKTSVILSRGKREKS